MRKFSLIIFGLIIIPLITLSFEVTYSGGKGFSDLSKYEILDILSIKDSDKRFVALKKLYSNSEDKGNFIILPDLCKTAIKVNRYDEAEKFADHLILLAHNNTESFHYGNAIHDANIVLGMIALRDNDIEKAKMYLLKAGNTKKSPQLKSFGPNLMLAKALLEKHEGVTVKEYFILMKNIWKMDNGQLDSWIATIGKGAIPYLDRHLSK